MRQAAQCMGRALRGKSDYGLMVFADKASSSYFKYKQEFSIKSPKIMERVFQSFFILQ